MLFMVFFCSIDLDTGTQAVLHIKSLGHALCAFINGKLAGILNLNLVPPTLLEVKASPLENALK